MRNTGLFMVACVAIALLVAPVALSQAPPKGGAVVSSVSVTATVTKINQKTRELTLKAEDGQTYNFVAGDAVQNLGQVKKGDVVTVSYTEAVAYEIRKGGSAGTGSTAAAAAAPLGAKPAGVVGAQTTVTVKVAAIDPKAPSITFALPSGDSRTVKVKYPEKLQGVNVGDTVDVAYTKGWEFVRSGSRKRRRKSDWSGFACTSLSLNVYVFNPGGETPTVLSSLAISF